MSDQLVASAFTVPLSLEAHRLAKQFCGQQADQQKAKQIYLNTLSVFAVQFYLRCMGIEADRTTSQSQDWLMQQLMDVADLNIPTVGRLECCAVLPDAQTVHISPETWTDRVGYVAVQFEPSLRSAIVLGFVPETGIGEMPIAQLRSLDELLQHLRQHATTRVNLGQWVVGVVDAGWRSVETLVNPDSQLALSLRNQLQTSKTTIRRAKLLDLGLQLGSHPLALLVAVTPLTEQAVEILMQIHPTGGAQYLPSELDLVLHTEQGEVLQEVRSRHHDNYIQLKRFRGQAGEQFDIQVTFGTISFMESFVI